jgi:TatD DNase family protein
MIDTHAHLDFPEFDQDREEVISRAFNNGVKAIINVGVDLERSRKSVEVAESHENIFAVVGFHPHEAGEKNRIPGEEEFAELKNLARSKKVKAIGEIGLDYFYYKKPEQVELQKELFLKQIEIAKELKLPVAIHCRDAWKDLYEILNTKYKIQDTKFVLHCYSGEKKDTEKFLELPNVYFSFSGNITYPKPAERARKLTEAVKMIPLDKIMLDSDAPFLAPQEFRGKRNEPIFVKYIARKIAKIKGIGEEETERVTDENAGKFFSI